MGTDSQGEGKVGPELRMEAERFQRGWSGGRITESDASLLDTKYLNFRLKMQILIQ